MSFGKRVDGFSGRRSEARAEVMCPAAATTVTWSKVLLVMDICPAGARLRGSELPPFGTDMLLKIGDLEVLATVVWGGEDECGVEFDELVPGELIDRLEADSKWALHSKLTPDERIAIAHWAVGKPTRH